LGGYLHGTEDKITNFIDLEAAARPFEDTIISAYNGNCPIARQYSRNISWWNQDLVERRRKGHRLYSAAKKSGFWTDHKRSLTQYNRTPRQAKRKSKRRHCEEIEKAPKCARLQKILSRDRKSAVSSLQLESREYTKTEGHTLKELLHFPHSKIILEPSVSWDGPELEFPKWNVSRAVLSGFQKCYKFQ
jgi:hypothetical protein